MIGIDWFAVVLLGVAYIVSSVRTLPVSLRNWVWAIALFIIAGVRLMRGASGTNLIFVLISAGFGVKYAMAAMRTSDR